jgi:Uma2 family endonuclease
MSPDILLERGQRISVDLYHRMIESGMFSEDDRLELIDGWLVQKMPHSPPHDSCIQLVAEALNRILPPGYCLRNQSAVTFSDSEPEPDITVVYGAARSFVTRHPGPEEIALIVEVAHTSLSFDQRIKQPLYARERIPCYWIVDVINRCVEIYKEPSGPMAEPRFQPKQVLTEKDTVSLEIAGREVAKIPVSSLLP